MHIVRSRYTGASGKVYESILLRESYREGKKVKKRTVANLSNCSPEEIAAFELALKHKKNLGTLTSQERPTVTEGLSFGGVWTAYQIAKRLGIVDALGHDRQGQLALWQVLSRVLEQGSRLSSVRLGEIYAIASTINLNQGFNEDDLYKNLYWLSQHQSSIEDRLFSSKKGTANNLFLYDVTSTYLEGDKNELADWGYNRDKKKGKKQVVIGLLTSSDGTPVSTEVFRGNTQDTSTFASQIMKAKERFNCESVTFVGDRGMIKSGQIDTLQEHGFHHITAITKAQIETLMKAGAIQLGMFDHTLVEVVHNGLRYILRRNPIRAEELSTSRAEKQASIEKLVQKQNEYLQDHPKARLEVALKAVQDKVARLKLQRWLTIHAQGRILSIVADGEALTEDSKLDGCYVIKTDLSASEASSHEVHDRYKDLALVEAGFRTVKSDMEIRPAFVRSEANTRGHVLIVMLAYMIIRELNRLWQGLYLTVEEGLRSLSTLTLLEMSFGNGNTFQQVPEPRDRNKSMLDIAGIVLPKILPRNQACVVTRKPRRKSVVKI